VHRDVRLANILLAVYAALALLSLSLPAGPWVIASKRLLGYVLLPGEQRGASAFEALARIPTHWSELVQADLANRDLRERLIRANLLETEAHSVLEENSRLREILGLKSRLSWRFQTARVIERDPASWFGSVIVDKGESRGVKPGDGVFALEGGRLAVAGRVVEASTDTARVLLLSDELSSVAAQIAPAGWQGLVEGQNQSRLRMGFIPWDASPRVGDEVLTSPVSLTFPPNILIGSVSRVLEVDPHLPYRVVEVYPAVHPSKVWVVLIREAKP
jgi:rod shape-determining protein MreC